MAGIYGPPWRVDGPAPSAPLYTLLGAARIVEDVDEREVERWVNGVAVYPYPPDLADAWDACATLGSNVVKAAGGVVPVPEFGAMVVYLAATCSSLGIFGAGMTNDEAQQRYVARALASFAAVEAAAVEREFLAGDVLGNNPHLADGQGTFPWGNTATTVVNGFALLEDVIAVSEKRGMIHCSPSLALAAGAAPVVFEDARMGVLRTINGTVVAPGAGYRNATGANPDGHPAASGAQEWAYATGPVEIRRSDPHVVPADLSQALDRETNTITYRVERFYVVDWDTDVQAAVLIDRCTTECGAAP